MLFYFKRLRICWIVNDIKEDFIAESLQCIWSGIGFVVIYLYIQEMSLKAAEEWEIVLGKYVCALWSIVRSSLIVPLCQFRTTISTVAGRILTKCGTKSLHCFEKIWFWAIPSQRCFCVDKCNNYIQALVLISESKLVLLYFMYRDLRNSVYFYVLFKHIFCNIFPL
jgi:hypothetical protein